MVYAALLVGLGWDGLHLARVLLRREKWVCAVLDAVYCVLAVALGLLALFIADDGQVRVFLVLGAALGLALYFAGIHPVLRGLEGWFGKKLQAIRRKFSRNHKDKGE
ncbi:MAG: spore cortex biosynthesis protein YabQ [Christensenellales bacterium]